MIEMDDLIRLENDFNQLILYLEQMVTSSDGIKSELALFTLRGLASYKGKYAITYPIGTEVFIHPRTQQEYYEYIQSDPDPDRNWILEDALWYNQVSKNCVPFKIKDYNEPEGYTLADIPYGITSTFEESQLMSVSEYKQYFNRPHIWLGDNADRFVTESFENLKKSKVIGLYREDVDKAKISVTHSNNHNKELISYVEVSI